MILPWRVDVPQDRLPFVNWLLIAAIIAVFAWQVPQDKQRNDEIDQIISSKPFLTQQDVNDIKKIKVSYDDYLLHGFTGKGLFTHMWLHGGLIHLIGNLLFLWIFGNAVCAKIGNIIYLPIYIFLGICAGITYLFFSDMPMLGASGAINGVVGMYLVLFPTNSITCYWSFSFLYWKEFEAPSYAIILLWFVYDVFGAAIGGDNVAYFAHIGGFAVGFAIAVSLLKIKYITMTRYEKSLLEVFSDAHSKPQSKVPLWNRADMVDNPQPVVADVPTENKISVPVLSENDFFRGSQPLPELTQLVQPTTQSTDEFIRFSCDCGKRIKIAAQYAGRTGKCPQCKKPVKIPNQ